jgi:hypothetical protein
MKRPEIIGWEVTTNENGIKMATLPRDTMEEIVKYIEYADQALRIHDVSSLLKAEREATKEEIREWLIAEDFERLAERL